MEASCTIKFKLVKHLITFPAYVNDKGPFNFWLDTAGPGLMIAKPLADQLGLEVLDTGGKGVGAGGEVPVVVTTVDSLKLAEIEFKKVQAYILDLKGVDKKFRFKFHGCIGYDLLKGFKVCIDYANRKLTLTLST